ncbi:D-alanyl-D-alanine carboxypeptidase [Georgenia satyanarayanai]|uniref:D-alanyl-D-alanine carboxypeptidase n=1 Tax=Georgenia satyanarayanai TaxID=860221 RepID=A0A2Y8ZWP6_9MICO|nr:D-alanyl-D-alanine carboxypeptidase family protein [Georgenia satyanarayanai]PYG01937.1 D-alanyl-D-alanine carboxypeptidase-like protein [Georgenia satyanarayanai]SSA36740.1 D-alanyl-D-alanine carboxypeptidase [Georgenia satyanarayanai]
MTTTPQHPAEARRRLLVLVLAAAVVVVAVVLLGRPGPLGAFAHETRDRAPVSVPAGDQPELAGLDPELAARFRRAQAAAAEEGYPLRVTSGARTAEEQQRLLDEAVEEHGSPAAARRWVLPPEQSAHVQGKAIDVGPAESRDWLADHGAEFGLCLVYENEPWHVEALAAPGTECPPLVRDAAAVG